jgi:hypothetical protein
MMAMVFFFVIVDGKIRENDRDTFKINTDGTGRKFVIQVCKMHAFYYISGDVTTFPLITVWNKYTCGAMQM